MKYRLYEESPTLGIVRIVVGVVLVVTTIFLVIGVVEASQTLRESLEFLSTTHTPNEEQTLLVEPVESSQDYVQPSTRLVKVQADYESRFMQNAAKEFQLAPMGSGEFFQYGHNDLQVVDGWKP